MKSFSMPRQCISRGVGLALLGVFLLGICGCGSSSNRSNGNIDNGNMGNVSTTTTTGSISEDPPTVPPGTPLANVALPVGTWGGGLLIDTGPVPATLTVSTSGSLVTLPCGEMVSYSKPILLDSAGRFDVQGTLVSHSVSTGASPVTLTGQVAVNTVSGKSTTTIFLGVDGSGVQSENGTYALVLGVTAPSSGVNCP